MNAKTFACLFGIACCGAGVVLADLPNATPPTFLSPAVRALAAQLAASPRVPDADLEAWIAALPAGTTDIADVVEALLIAGYPVFTVVEDAILAGSITGNAADVAARVGTRVLLLNGPTVTPLIDAGILAAAVEIGRRTREAPAAGSDAQRVQTEQERARLQRMLQQGLITDKAYQDSLDRMRAAAQRTAQSPGPDTYGINDWDFIVFRTLFTLGLVESGNFGTSLQIGADAGGTASSQ
jgi:hypothetical protein